MILLKNFIENFTNNLHNIREKITFCDTCNGLTDMNKSLCNICTSSIKNMSKIAIVEEYLDMLTIEQSGGYDGVYHILGGAISPIN